MKEAKEAAFQLRSPVGCGGDFNIHRLYFLFYLDKKKKQKKSSPPG